LVLGGIGLQFVLAVVVLRVPGARDLFDGIAWVVNGVITQADDGIEFVFGPELGSADGPAGFVFAFRALPVIVFFASLMALLFHIGVMQRVIWVLAWVLRRTMGVTGAEALAMAANVFVGQTEAPLMVKPLLERMTRAQLMTLMVGGFATIAGSVLAAYVTMLGGGDEASRILFAKHLITASVLSAPAALVMARILVPETETPPAETKTELRAAEGERHANALDAAAVGATDGLRLAMNVAAMLVAFVSIVALVNWPLKELSDGALSVQIILGTVFSPLAYVMGVPMEEIGLVGRLMGEKVVVTEYIAYQSLSGMVQEGTLSERGAMISAYALCGFANFASIGIQIGGLSALAPGRRREFSKLAVRAMCGGALASWMTACIAGIVVG
jgi:CNT family concentrative nucleoside transporter